MSTEANKAVVRQGFDAFNRGDIDAFEQIYTEDCAWHGPGGRDVHGIADLKAMVTVYNGAFPGSQITVHDQFGEGDRVATRWTVTGTHDGDLEGIAPTGHSVHVSGLTISRHVGDRIAEEWELFDELTMMRQIGVIAEGG